MDELKDIHELALNTFTAMDEERKEDCIHCGEEWYAIHYKDGVCHSCQKKGLPGRNEIQKRKKITDYFKIAAILVISMTPGWFICDVLGHPRTAVIIFCDPHDNFTVPIWFFENSKIIVCLTARRLHKLPVGFFFLDLID